MNISFLAAYLGGMVSIFSPCSALVIPNFFAAISNTEQKRKTIFQFIVGLFIAMLPIILGARIIQQAFTNYGTTLFTIIGVLALLAGIIILVSDNFSLPPFFETAIQHKYLRGSQSFTLGLIAGIGSTTCIGPILGVIMSLAANSASLFTPFLLAIFYLLGIISPVLLATFLFLKFGKWHSFKRISSKVVRVFGKELLLTKILTSLLLFFVAYIYLIHNGNLSHIFAFENIIIQEKLLGY